mgnify:CR=1 FL=1
MGADLALQFLLMAVWRRKPENTGQYVPTKEAGSPAAGGNRFPANKSCNPL